MGLILGFLIGFIVAVGLLIFLIYWLCSRSSNVAVAKFVNGIALALAHKEKRNETATPKEDGETTNEAMGTHKDKPGW